MHGGQYSICTLLELQQYLYLGNTYINNLAHKILHTFEKMDAINPTFELIKETSIR